MQKRFGFVVLYGFGPVSDCRTKKLLRAPPKPAFWYGPYETCVRFYFENLIEK